MTLASAFLELDHAASRLEDAFRHLEWAVTTTDMRDAPAVIEQWQDLAADFSGLAREVATAARSGRLAVNGRLGMQGAHGALTACQGHYCRLWLAYSVESLPPGRRRALDPLSRRRDRCADWARGVNDAHDRCMEPMHEVGVALGKTWQELVERAWLGLILQTPGVGAAAPEETVEPDMPVFDAASETMIDATDDVGA